jgi:hypothetical protein
MQSLSGFMTGDSSRQLLSGLLSLKYLVFRGQDTSTRVDGRRKGQAEIFSVLSYGFWWLFGLSGRYPMAAPPGSY